MTAAARRPLPDMLYIAVDGTGVPMVAAETEGRDGKGEDGKARTREVKLAVVFTQAAWMRKAARSATRGPLPTWPPSPRPPRSGS